MDLVGPHTVASTISGNPDIPDISKSVLLVVNSEQRKKRKDTFSCNFLHRLVWITKRVVKDHNCTVLYCSWSLDVQRITSVLLKVLHLMQLVDYFHNESLASQVNCFLVLLHLNATYLF